MKPFLLVLQLALLQFCSITAASDSASQGEWAFSLSAGYGQIDNPLSFRDDIKMFLLPGISYYGKRFYLENTHLGYSLFEQPTFYVDLVGQFNEDGFFYHFDGRHTLGLREILVPDFGYSDPGDTPDIRIRRHLSYLGGLSATWKTQLADIRLSGLVDLTAGHHGTEYHLSLSRDLQLHKLKLRLVARYLLKSATTTNYYYNFTSSELGGFNWYSLPASRHYQLRLVMAYPLTEQLDVIGQLQYTRMDNALDRTLLLNNTAYRSQFIGLRYRF
ncbi:MipA/OmpV family protein [Arsukibacterium sp.]|uniref:MipA/OmpV family protein n=1 Tax=Arsukibacterium sp. TaxID=1977258 RepID=UPI002FDB550A